ncbi:hypothetical protein E2C01_102343 [Portunus trituberculatus]|uniref:Uncharacterized protein n=1 Tax=Portunus trituberculatus TaxID=210409 RepID=A0A5B7KMC9_PORTR|nr:hypothetical protein [Portunus trituberculatus]
MSSTLATPRPPTHCPAHANPFHLHKTTPTTTQLFTSRSAGRPYHPWLTPPTLHAPLPPPPLTPTIRTPRTTPSRAPGIKVLHALADKNPVDALISSDCTYF